MVRTGAASRPLQGAIPVADVAASAGPRGTLLIQSLGRAPSSKEATTIAVIASRIAAKGTSEKSRERGPMAQARPVFADVVTELAFVAHSSSKRPNRTVMARCLLVPGHPWSQRHPSNAITCG